MTDVSLREYVERIISERDRALEARFAAAQRALDAAIETLEHRLAAVNAFKTQISDERALYVQRDQLTAILLPLQKSIDALERGAANMSGRYWALGVFLAFVTLLVNVAVTLIVWAWS